MKSAGKRGGEMTKGEVSVGRNRPWFRRRKEERGGGKAKRELGRDVGKLPAGAMERVDSEGKECGTGA